LPTRPTAIGKYLVVGELGRGGQAQVFRALHPTLGRDVAIKWSHHAAGQDSLNLLLREGKVLSEFDHPAIVRVFDLDVHEGRPFLVMEYVRGSDLEQYAGRHSFSPRQAAALVARLARGLAVAHARGIIHQDIKPGNILVDEAGQPRLSDFGLARWEHQWAKDNSQQPSGGTLGYMAPEQLADSNAVSAASDTFALGGVLYYLLTGQCPREGANNPALAWQKVLDGEIDWKSLQDRKVPKALA
jgi:serine/threonine protein kinase